MKVFVSWSGEKSREVALALRAWLPGVINSVNPFVSAKDIDPGARWQVEIARQLEDTNYGIICVTRDNQHAPWLNFEAGALAKTVELSRVIPLAVDLNPSDIESPLGHFQAQPASEEGIHAIVRSINAASTPPLAIELLEKSFRKWWPELETNLQAIQDATPAAIGDTRSERELLEETLDIVRSLARSSRSLPVGDFKASYYHHLLAKIVPREELNLHKRPRAAEESAMVDALWNLIREQAQEAGVLDPSDGLDGDEQA
jgi:TIR domain